MCSSCQNRATSSQDTCRCPFSIRAPSRSTAPALRRCLGGIWNTHWFIYELIISYTPLDLYDNYMDICGTSMEIYDNKLACSPDLLPVVTSASDHNTRIQRRTLRGRFKRMQATARVFQQLDPKQPSCLSVHAVSEHGGVRRRWRFRLLPNLGKSESAVPQELSNEFSNSQSSSTFSRHFSFKSLIWSSAHLMQSNALP